MTTVADDQLAAGDEDDRAGDHADGAEHGDGVRGDARPVRSDAAQRVERRADAALEGTEDLRHRRVAAYRPSYRPLSGAPARVRVGGAWRAERIAGSW